MEAPGEKLLIKLWETLAERGIGSLLKPWQIRREGKAIAEVQAESILLIAQAEKTAESIRHTQITPEYRVLQLASKGETKVEPKLEDETLIRLATKINYEETLRTELNTAKSVLVAEAILADESGEVSSESINQDWLYRWREYAGGVSDDELQTLWGALLAGEIKSPGAFSLRTLEFIRNLSPHEAKQIEKLMQFVIDHYIYKGKTDYGNKSILLDAFGLKFSELLTLQSLGVISGVEGSGGLCVSHTGEGNGLLMISSKTHALTIIFKDSQTEVSVPCYVLTNLGIQLHSLCITESNQDHLKMLEADIRNQGFEVHLSKIEKHGDIVVYKPV